jgi:hypothetical protein
MMRGDLKAVLAYASEHLSACSEDMEAMKRLFKSKPETKRPRNAYMLWLKENRDRLKSENENMAMKELMKVAGQEWKELASDERGPFEEAAQKLKEEYNAGRGEARTVKSSGKNRDYDLKTTYEWDDETPEGFNGPHKAKLLKGLTEAGRARGKGTFDTLSDAVEAANALGSKCGGITKCKAGYQLRLGGDLLDEKNVDFCDHTITWKKNGDDAETYDQRKSKKKVKKVVKPDSDSDESGSDSASEETNDSASEETNDGASEETNDGASEETNDGASEETNDGAPAKDTFKEEDSMSAAGSDDENSDEEEDSEDDEEIETVPWEYKGTVYFVDEENNLVYDKDTQEVVGKRVNGKLKKNKK